MNCLKHRVNIAVLVGIASLAFIICPLGFVNAQERDGADARVNRFKAYATEISKAVEAGELTEEEAEKKLLAMRKRLAQQPAAKPTARDMDARVERYKAYVERIKKAVEAGELSEEEAEKKLIETRQRMFGQPAAKSAEGDKETRIRRFRAYAEEIQKAVDTGDFSEEEAGKKLLAMRKRLAQQPAVKSAEGDKEARIRRFRAYAEEIQKAVEAGDLSEEEAERKLLAIRKRLAQQPAEKPAERDMDALVKRYKAYAAQIKKAVEAGEVSEEEAEKKLIETRLRLFPQPKQKK
jgi:hypothetical protein